MQNILKKAPSFNGGGYNQEFYLQIPNGLNLKRTLLELTNLEHSQIKRVRVEFNGSPIYDIEGMYFVMRDKYLKQKIASNMLTIPFADETMLNQPSQNLTGLVTMPNENWVLRIDVGAPTSAQTQANAVPAIKAHFIASPAPEFGRVTMPRIMSEVISSNRSGELEVDHFVRKQSIAPTALRRAFYRSGNVAELEIRQNGKVIYEATKAVNDYELERRRREVNPAIQWVDNGGNARDVYAFAPVDTGFGIADKLRTDQGAFATIFEIDDARSIEVAYELVELVASQAQLEKLGQAGVQIW